MVLEDGTRHKAENAGEYEVFRFERLVLSLNPETVFPRAGPPLGAREMSIPQLEARAAELEQQGIYPHAELFEIQKKFSIPFACLVFGLIGLALGASNRRDGKLASFVIGLAVIFIYYVLLWFGQAVVRGHIVPPWLGAWAPNIVLGVMGGLLFLWRDRGFDRPLRLPDTAPFPLRRDSAAQAADGRRSRSLRRHAVWTRRRARSRGAGRHLLHFDVPGPVGQGVSGPGDVGDAVVVLLVRDAAVHLLHPPAVGAAGVARHRRPPHEKQRARGDEGVRHQLATASRCR